MAAQHGYVEAGSCLAYEYPLVFHPARSGWRRLRNIFASAQRNTYSPVILKHNLSVHHIHLRMKITDRGFVDANRWEKLRYDEGSDLGSPAG